ncbi:MAG TPA: magnesium transporter, partial [Magnetospirillaceae bacterium]|nr:magnesium transporter [Magnetospirillaceae bacterium]
RNVYVVDSQKKLLGIIDVASLIQADHTVRADVMMKPTAVFLHPEADQEKAVFMAVKDDVVTIPVIDHDGHFLGSVTAHTIIDIMHAEHIEDSLLTAGLRRGKSQIFKLATERTGLIVRSRAPWLIFGLAVGLGLGLISSFFETQLQEKVALAYFIPVVAYIADSVGTQTEAIAVRALATMKIGVWRYLGKELLVGLVLGVTMGVLGGFGAWFIAQSPEIGLIVALSLFFASTVAAVMAAAIPMIFKKLGKDPALGSGPLATAFQDVISVLIYFLFAVIIL